MLDCGQAIFESCGEIRYRLRCVVVLVLLKSYDSDGAAHGGSDKRKKQMVESDYRCGNSNINTNINTWLQLFVAN